MNSRTRRTPGLSAAPEVGTVLRALLADAAGVRNLLTCTLAASSTVFEPGYLTLSTSMVQVGLRAPGSPAPLPLASAILVLALITLMAGAFADLIGRKAFLVTGLAMLTASNALGLVWLGSPGPFLVADLLNSVAGAIVLPASIAIVTLAFQPQVRPLAYGILFGAQGTATVVSALLIPLLGGLWEGRATFVPVLLLGVASLVLARRGVPESRAPDSLPRRGIVLNLVFVSGLFAVLFLILTNTLRGSVSLVTMSLAVLLALLALVVRRLRSRSRSYPGIELYGGRDLGVAIFAGLVILLGQGAFFSQISPFFRQVQQVGEVATALRFVPFVIGIVAGGILVARATMRFGPRRILAGSILLLAAALFALAFVRTDTPFWLLAVPTAVLGFSVGCGGAVRTAVVMAAQPEGFVGSSSAINSAAGQAGNALGIILSSVLVTREAHRILPEALRAAGVGEDVVASVARALDDGAGGLLSAALPELPADAQEVGAAVYAQAFTTGMSRMFLLLGLAMAVSAVAVWFGMRRQPPPAGSGEEPSPAPPERQ